MFSIPSSKETPIRLYCFFLMADGDISPAGRERLDQICREMEVDDYHRDYIIWRCNKPYDKQSWSHAEHIRGCIKKTLRNEEGKLGSSGNLFTGKGAQVSVLWTLCNLGYADGECSEEKKRIIQYIAERWKVAPSVLADLTDTVQALAALTAQKEWVKTTGRPFDAVRETVEELDRNIQMMADNVRMLIAEADIAEREEK